MLDEEGRPGAHDHVAILQGLQEHFAGRGRKRIFPVVPCCREACVVDCREHRDETEDHVEHAEPLPQREELLLHRGRSLDDVVPGRREDVGGSTHRVTDGGVDVVSVVEHDGNAQPLWPREVVPGRDPVRFGDPVRVAHRDIAGFDVGHRASDRTLGRHVRCTPPSRVRVGASARKPTDRRSQSDHPVLVRRPPHRPGDVVALGDLTHAGGNRDGRTTTRTARGDVESVWVQCLAVEFVLGVGAHCDCG